MGSQTVKTRILIMSDTHCASLDGGPGLGFKRPLPCADLLIHCGDLTYTGKPKQYGKALDMLKEIDAPVKLVIAGNHDFTLDREFMLGHHKQHGLRLEEAEERYNEAKRLWTAADGGAKNEGITFLDEGMHTISLPNNANVNVYASPYTPEFCDWGFPYARNEDRYNPPDTSLLGSKTIAVNPIPSLSSAESPIDIMMTHGPPYGRLDKTSDGLRVGCPHLLRALMRARPLVHCFGHIHEARGAERVAWARDAGDVAMKASTPEMWQKEGWVKGIADVQRETQGWGFDDVQTDNAAVVSASRDGGKPLRRGEETLLVNASIMNVRYRAAKTPWLVTLDLPASSPA